MAIRVKFVGERRKAEHETVISLPAGATVADLLVTLGIAVPGDHMVSRNSEVVGPTAPLRDGDHVSIHVLPSS